MCHTGCYCPDGYIREVADGDCILVTDCPRHLETTPGSVACETNTCGVGNQATCASPNPWNFNMCFTGCYCPEGYIREVADGACIPVVDCPRHLETTPGSVACKASDCGMANQATCANPNPVNNRMCHTGCYCPDGYIREVADGDCIPVADCLATTGAR